MAVNNLKEYGVYTYIMLVPEPGVLVKAEL